jgi:hypothetical protein
MSGLQLTIQIQPDENIHNGSLFSGVANDEDVQGRQPSLLGCPRTSSFTNSFNNQAAIIYSRSAALPTGYWDKL